MCTFKRVISSFNFLFRALILYLHARSPCIFIKDEGKREAGEKKAKRKKMRVKKILEHNNNRHRVHMTKFRENRKTEMQIFEMGTKKM